MAGSAGSLAGIARGVTCREDGRRGTQNKRARPGLGGRMENKSQIASLLRELYPRGLGELLMMGHKGNVALLGNLVMEKGGLVLKNRELLDEVPLERVAPCFDISIVGAVCD